MTMDLDRVGFESEPKRITWAPDDCSLYALSLGSGFDELEKLCSWLGKWRRFPIY